MTTKNKTPSTVRQPGKPPAKRKAKRIRPTIEQERTHRCIEVQSEATQNQGQRRWRPEEFPELYGLVEAAKREAQSRPLKSLRRPFTFSHHGRRYTARTIFGLLDRVIVERGGCFIASTDFFDL